MKIRKAKTADLDQIERIYDHIHDFEESGVVTIGWIRGVYPIRETAEIILITCKLWESKMRLL